MFSAIIQIIKDIFWLIVRGKKQSDNPVNQIQNERQQFQKGVVSGDEDSVNIILINDINKLRDNDSSGSNSKRP